MDLVAKVMNKYSWLSFEEASELVETAVGFYYSLRYPCEPSVSEDTRPLDTFMDEWSVLRICDEISQRNGFNTALGYHENGISFNFDSAWVSEALRSSIVPIMGVL